MPTACATTRLTEMATAALPRRRGAVVAVALAGLGLAVGAACLLAQNGGTTLPYSGWSATARDLWWVAVLSAAGLSLVGPWLAWRLPTNPTGWWISASGAALAGWVIGVFSSGPASSWLQDVLPPFGKAALVVAVLRWPTGRLPARWERPLALALSAYVTLGVLAPFVGTPLQSLSTAPAHPRVGDPITGLLVQQVVTVLLVGIAPALFLAVMYRRRAAMPPGVRATTVPTFVAATLLGATELWVFTSVLLSTPLEQGTESLSSVSALRYLAEFGRFGAVAVLLAWSEALRRRAARTSATTAHSIEVPAGTGDGSRDIADVLDDPTARLRLLPRAGRWAAAPGPRAPAAADRIGPPSARIEVVDPAGRPVAVVEHAAGSAVDRVTRDTVLASIGLAVVRHARQEAAEQRRLELQQGQRRVLDAQDQARRNLERDLHDGVQQRLVALALEASLLARAEAGRSVSETERRTLVDGIDRAVAVTRQMLATGPPAVLDPGLAAGLVALDATIPLPTTLRLDGDVPAGHPAAAALWFVASEAVANSLKHAGARSLALTLEVDAERAQLIVSDDGCGGVDRPPTAILGRLGALPSTVGVSSPPGHGTSIRVSVDLASRAVP